MTDALRKRRRIAIGLLITCNSLLVLIVIFVIVCIYGLIDAILNPVMLKGLGPTLGLLYVAPSLCFLALLICVASWITGRANKSIFRFNIGLLILIVATGITSISSLYLTPYFIGVEKYRAAIVYSTTHKNPPLEEIREAMGFAYKHRDSEMIMSIADHYVDSPARDRVYMEMLQVLMSQKPQDDQSINYILSKNPDLNISVSYHEHPIQWAILTGNIAQVRMLVDAGFDPNKCFEPESSVPQALSAAVQGKRYDIVELLVQRGINWVKDGQVEEGGPMRAAISNKDKQMVRILLDAGPQDLSHLPAELRKRLGVTLFLNRDDEIHQMFFDRGFPPGAVKGFEVPR